MKPTVLIIRDETQPTELLRRNLEREGFNVATARPSDKIPQRLAEVAASIILLDGTAQVESGIKLCRQIRLSRNYAIVPVIVMIPRDEEANRARWFDAGADGYITKPFSMADLIARLHAATPRAGLIMTSEILKYRDVTLDLGAFRVTRGDRVVHLGPTEFRLLRFFLEHPHRVFSRENLLEVVWGGDAEVELRTVDVHIRRLRKAINFEGTAPDIIRTVRAAGYAMDIGAEGPVEEATPVAHGGANDPKEGRLISAGGT